MSRRIKFIQVNIYKGRYFDELLVFLRKENPDIIALQEVTSGDLNLYHDKTINLFEEVRSRLSMDGVFDATEKLSDVPDSTFGIAVLTKFPIVRSKVVSLRDFRQLTRLEFNDDRLWPEITRHLLDVTVDIDGIALHAMSVHGAWGIRPIDSEEKERQARVIVEYLKSLSDEPFVMGGDLNMTPETEVISLISSVSRNLMLDSDVKQTTHPKVHKIVPRGHLVDYIFTSDHFEKISLEVPLVTVSDHLPVVAQLEFEG